ncbi:thy-1 membrane glycoprotein [Myxocyprinus asiaticus]|uniref:thy-1 membrane glycoprotein n=1 Tax=Myxocyprinus asiaticus TaxID=70543 RepID=UPI00222169BE|nr:thy-1 membrane glycoprotein [Myxocyprinus asiaticus]XP_051539607.1 thy-1 membrane glycoprotein [Myxocyprinus asiaticus]
MMCYTVYTATLCLLGFAAAQTSLQISSCLTKDQNLRMLCKFTPDPDAKLPKNCYYKTEDKMVGSTNISLIPDSTFRNRATVAIVNDVCQLNLTGFSDDKPRDFTCFIKQTAIESKTATVEKSKLLTCSAWCSLQHSVVALLLAFLTFPLMSELL